MMQDATNSANSGPRLPHIRLDPSLYNPQPLELEFFKAQTGIRDDDELKRHILAVQKDAWEVINYVCIQSFGFMNLKISKFPWYKEFLERAKGKPDAIYLEYACCFGNDVRKAVADGFPLQNAVATDLRPAFWHLGHKLFNSNPEKFPVPFIQGDVLDESHIAPAPPHYSSTSTPRPDLNALTSLTPLQGHVSFIHASAFFNVFQKEDQVRAVKALASLLSPEPGSMIFGSHSTSEVSGDCFLSSVREPIYGFSPRDWKALWDGEVFEKGSVEVEASIGSGSFWNERGKEAGHGDRVLMLWRVTRI